MTLKEAVWRSGERAPLDRALSRSPFDPSEEQKDLWAAYRSGERPTIVLCMRYLERDEEAPTLKEYLRRIRPEGLYDYLFTADTYAQSRVFGEAPPDPEGLEPTGDPLVDEVLRPSRGYLLWQFQLESLAQILGLPRPEAVRLRRYVNQKRPEALQPLREVSHAKEAFPSGLSLKTLLEKRLLFDAALPGHWRAARLLAGAE